MKEVTFRVLFLLAVLLSILVTNFIEFDVALSPIGEYNNDFSSAPVGSLNGVVWDGFGRLEFASAGGLPSGLVGEWSFENNFVDGSGNGNDGGCSGNSCPSLVSGKNGQGYKFDGNDFVEIPHSTSLDFSGGFFTLTAWVKPDLGSTGYPRIVSKNYWSNGFKGIWSLYMNNDDITQCWIHKGNGNNVYSDLSNVDAGQWNFLSCRYGSNGLIVGSDGVYTDARGIGITLVDTFNYPVSIGSDLDNSGNSHSHFKGVIDDVRIFNRGLSNSEIENVGNYVPVSNGGIFTSEIIQTSGTYSDLNVNWIGNVASFEISTDSGNNWCSVVNGGSLIGGNCALPSEDFRYRANFNSESFLNSVNFSWNLVLNDGNTNNTSNVTNPNNSSNNNAGNGQNNEPVCGDTQCNLGEDCSSCAIDCGDCAVVPRLEILDPNSGNLITTSSTEIEFNLANWILGSDGFVRFYFNGQGPIDFSSSGASSSFGSVSLYDNGVNKIIIEGLEDGVYTLSGVLMDNSGNALNNPDASSNVVFTVDSLFEYVEEFDNEYVTPNYVQPGITNSGSNVQTVTPEGYWLNTYNENAVDFSEIGTLSKNLGFKERIFVKIDGMDYYIGVVFIATGRATLELNSRTNRAILAVNDENEFDLNNDGDEDVKIIFDSVQGNMVSTTISSVDSSGGVFGGFSLGSLFGSSDDGEEPISSTNEEISSESLKVPITIAVSVIVIVLIVFAAVYFIRGRRKI